MSYEYEIGEYVNPISNLDQQWKIEDQWETADVMRYRLLPADPRIPWNPETNAVVVGGSDMVPTHTIHAHVHWEAVDCDGRQSSDRMERMNGDERRSKFGDFDFKARLAGNVISWCYDGTLEVVDDTMSWYAQTDEGYERHEVRWCEDIRCIS